MKPRDGKIAVVAGATRGAGRGIAALAADPGAARFNGRVLASWDLGDLYGVSDADGTRPHYMRWLQSNQPEVAAAWKKVDDASTRTGAERPTPRPDSAAER